MKAIKTLKKTLKCIKNYTTTIKIKEDEEIVLLQSTYIYKKIQIIQSFNPAFKGLFMAENGREKNIYIIYCPLRVIILWEYDFRGLAT